jgi:hypothetical protein
LYVLPAEAEVQYNLGRAAQRVGLLHCAVYHYEHVLLLAEGIDTTAAAADGAAAQLQRLDVNQEQQQQQSTDSMQVDADGTQQQQQQQQQEAVSQGQGQGDKAGLQQLGRGLVREAAHNLVLIYKGSGAHDLARQVMRQYLTF